MPDVVGVEPASIRQGVFAEDDLPARVENELRTVAHDRGLSLLEPAATPANACHPLGMLATGPVVCLSLDVTRFPLRVVKAANVFMIALWRRWPAKSIRGAVRELDSTATPPPSAATRIGTLRLR